MSGYYSNPKTNSKGAIINQLPSANAFTSALLNGIKYATSSVNNPAQATRNALAKKTVEDLMASKAYKTKTSGDKSGGSGGNKAQSTPTASVDVGGYTDFEAIARAQAEAEAARLAALRPYFFRSFILGSRVRYPAFFRIGRFSASASQRARERP